MLLLGSASGELAAVVTVVLILFLASLLAIAPLRKVRLPFTVAVMLVGFGLGVVLEKVATGGAHGGGGFLQLLSAGSHLTPALIFFVFLPPLVFESAFNLDARELNKNLVPILVLAIPALLLSTVITGGVVMLAGGASHGLTWAAALLFGALISATDPVAVVALFKDLGAPKRLGILVEGESLCNDGTAIVLFNLLLVAAIASVAPLAQAGARVGEPEVGQNKQVRLELQLEQTGDQWAVKESKFEGDRALLAAVERHHAKVKAGGVEAAYAQTTASFRAGTAAADFKTFVREHAGLYGAKALDLPQRSLSGDTGWVAGEARGEEGAVAVRFRLEREAGAWKVAGVNLGKQAPSGSIGQQIGRGVLQFLKVAVGGVLVGLILAWGLFALIGRVLSNEAVEISLSVVLAYAAFVVAEHFLHVSGVMAVVAAGLVAGSYGRTKVSPSVEEFMHAFWEYMAFVMNSLIFFFVGLVIARSIGWDEFTHLLPLLGAAVAAVIVARAIGVFGSVPLLKRSVEEIDLRYQTVMWWGGLRGAVSLALALTVFTHPALPRQMRDTVLILSAGIVLFTLLVNALTMQPLIKRLELDQPTPVDHFALAYAAHERVEVVRGVIERLDQEGAVLPAVLDQMRSSLGQRRSEARADLEALSREIEGDDQLAGAVAARVALSVEKREVMRRFSSGELTEGATKLLQSSTDQLLDLVKAGGQLPEERPVTVCPPLESRLLSMMEPLPLLGVVAQARRAHYLALDVEATRGLYLAARTVERTLAAVEEGDAIPVRALAAVQATYSTWKYRALERLNRLTAEFPEYAECSQGRLAELQALRAEAHALEHLTEAGLLTEKARANAKEQLVSREQELRAIRSVGLELDPKTLLRKVPAFAELPDVVLDALAGKLTTRTYLEGETVVTEGEAGNSMFLIARGCVGVYGQGEGGAEVQVAILDHGDFFGEMACLLGGTRRATVRARTPVNLLELSGETLDEELAKNAALDHEVRSSMVSRTIDRALLSSGRLRALSPEQRLSLSLGFEEERHAAGSPIASAGDPWRLTYVSHGRVRLGEEELADGAVLGEGAFSAEVLACDLVAVDDARLLVLPAERLARFQQENPATADAVVKALVELGERQAREERADPDDAA